MFHGFDGLGGYIVKTPKCTSCGSILNNIEAHSTIVECAYCGSRVVVENAMILKDVELDRSRELENLRVRLSTSVNANAIQNISRYASQILQIIPKDYISSYYFAYAEDWLNHHHYIKRFYNQPPTLTTEEDIEEIITHIFKYSRLRDQSLVVKYLTELEKTYEKSFVSEYDAWFENRKKTEENYDIIQRDVFICYRSIDQSIADQLVFELELDGNKCWISSRNLRPDDGKNYWDSITQAILNCKLFLVIHSSASMYSDDVKKEMHIASMNDKPRLQFKMDDSQPTSYFKEFFDGIPWIDASQNTRSAIEQLKHRVYDLINDLIAKNYEKEQIENVKINPRLSEGGLDLKTLTHPMMQMSKDEYLNGLLKKVLVDIENQIFDAAAKDLDNALYIDARNGYIWWLKLLVEFKAVDLNSLALYDDVVHSRNFKNAKLFGDQDLKEDVRLLELAITRRQDEIKRRKEALEQERRDNIENERRRIELEQKRQLEKELLDKKRLKRQAYKTQEENHKVIIERIKIIETEYEEKNRLIENQIKDFNIIRHRYEPILLSKWAIPVFIVVYIFVHLLLFQYNDINTFIEYAIILNCGSLLFWPIIVTHL